METQTVITLSNQYQIKETDRGRASFETQLRVREVLIKRVISGAPV